MKAKKKKKESKQEFDTVKRGMNINERWTKRLLSSFDEISMFLIVQEIYISY